jgi:tetraacyldisaccharide 4'-kinase
VLAPLSALYGRAVLARRRRAEARPASRRRLGRPVISIGNLAVGGSGKTPFTRWLASWLLSQHHRPSILSRGYGRVSPDHAVVIVSDGEHVLADVSRAGDEPLMLAQTVRGAAVLVCADRHRAGQVAESQLGCTVHLLDDGFQHLRLNRQIDLLLLDERDIEDRVLPAGRLREPLEAARSADAILWTGTADAADVAARLGVGAAFNLRRTSGPLTTLTAGEPPPRPGTPVVAVAGIARPDRFFDELLADGLDVRARLSYRDHHPYSADDLRRIRRTLDANRADVVVTTEKDIVRLRPLGPLPFAVAWRRVDVMPQHVDAFCAWLDARLESAARAVASRSGEPVA